MSFRHLGTLLLLVFLCLLAYGSDDDSNENSTTRRSTGSNKSTSGRSGTRSGPPAGHDGAGVVVDGWSIYIYRMSTHHRHLYTAAENFTGKGYAFMVLGLNGKNATEKFNWHCWTNGVTIELIDGTECKTIDLSDMDGFYRWSYHDEFSCTKTVYPGKSEYHYLAFYPSFSWKNVHKVKFQTGALGLGIREGSWLKIR